MINDNKPDYASPFSYRKNTMFQMRLPEEKGISEASIQRLWENNELSQENLIIIRGIGTLSFLTSHMIMQAFENETIPIDVKHFPNSSGKNPYLRHIKWLNAHGIIKSYSFTSASGTVGSKIYRLSGGASSWNMSTSPYGFSYFEKNKPSFFSEGKDILATLSHEQQYRYILGYLSLNEFYIKSINNHSMNLLSYYVIRLGNQLPAAVYKTDPGRYIITLSPRAEEPEQMDLKEVFFHVEKIILKLDTPPNDVILILLGESLSSIEKTYLYMKEQRIDVPMKLFFTTDFTVFQEQDVFTNLISYSPAASSYDRVSLHIKF